MRQSPYLFAGFGRNPFREYRVEDGNATTMQGWLIRRQVVSVTLRSGVKVTVMRSPLLGRILGLDIGDLSIDTPSGSITWSNVSGITKVAKRVENAALGMSDADESMLERATRTGQTDFGFGAIGAVKAVGEAQMHETPKGKFIDHRNGTVTHEESGLTFLTAPWGLSWNGQGFSGEPIKLDWRTATTLFGRGQDVSIGGHGGFYGSKLRAASITNGYTKGACRIKFDGFADWRLPTANELELLALGDEDRASDRHERLRCTLFPAFERDGSRVWSATGADNIKNATTGTAWASSGKHSWRLGDDTASLSGMILFVRDAQ